MKNLLYIAVVVLTAFSLGPDAAVAQDDECERRAGNDAAFALEACGNETAQSAQSGQQPDAVAADRASAPPYDLTTGYWTGEKPNAHSSLAGSWTTYRFHGNGVWQAIIYYQDRPGDPYRVTGPGRECGPWSWVEEGRTFHLEKRVRRGPEEGRVLGPDRIEVDEITLNVMRERSTTTWTYERVADHDAPEKFREEGDPSLEGCLDPGA